MDQGSDSDSDNSMILIIAASSAGVLVCIICIGVLMFYNNKLDKEVKGGHAFGGDEMGEVEYHTAGYTGGHHDDDRSHSSFCEFKGTSAGEGPGYEKRTPSTKLAAPTSKRDETGSSLRL